MAGQKEFTTQFIINAVLNGGFKSVFTQAQQEFIKLGAEIKNLQAIQRDIASYQKQAAAVQNTTQKLENLRQQMEKIGQQKGFLEQQIKEAQDAGKSTARLQERLAGLEQKELVLQQRIDNTSGALETQKERLNDTKERLDELGVSTDDMAAKDAELTEKIKELTEEQKKAAEGAGEFGNAGVQAIEAVGGAIAAAGIANAVRDIEDAYEECVGVAGDFGQAMSAVEAIAEVNVLEMKALKAEAKELGATTKFTAKQSANAMEYMAMAGWNASEMLAGMKGMTTLAAAAGEDLAQTSDIVTDNLTAFGLTAADTAHFADVLAAAAANSNTNISIMGETFKNSAAVAGTLGYSVEDVAVMVGLMANNAVKGSRAGTALRNIFNGLLGGVTLTAEAFGELEYSAVNYDGSMKGLMETVEDLRGYFDQMTEAERVNNAMAIAGMRGYNGLLAILNATDEDFQSLYASINNCSGAAERMAKVKLDNLNGDITLMDSAMEALQTTIGEQFNPELRELTQLKTELLNGANIFIQENPVLVKGIMAGGAAFGVMGTAIVGVNAAIKAYQALNLAALFTTAGPFLAVAGGIAGVTAAVVGLTEAKRDGGPAVRELTEAARDMWETMYEVNAAYEDTESTTIAAAGVAERYIGRLRELEAAEGGNAETSQEYQETLALLLQVMPGLSDCISQTTDEYGRSTYALEASKDALLEHVEALKQEAIAQALMEKQKELYAKYADVLLESERNSLKKREAEDKLAQAQERRADILEKLREQEAIEPNYHGGYFDTDVDAVRNMSEEYRALQSQLEACDSEIASYNETIDDCTNAMNRDATAAASAEAELDLLDQTQRRLGGTAEDLTAAEADVRNAIDGTMESVQTLTEAYEEAYKEAAESFAGQFGLFDEAKADADATVEAAQKALDTQLAYWQGYAENIAVLKEQSANSLQVTQENYDALMEYVRSGTPEAAGLAADMVKAVNEGNTQAIADLANTLGEIKESQDQAAQDVAEWTLGLAEQMDQLVLDMEKDVADMDLSYAAALSAQATIQGYIDGAEGMLPQVRETWAKVGQSALNALSGYLYIPQNAAGADLPAEVRARMMTKRGYASGTDDAVPGWAWVGEDGPELMRMRGGEQILPNSVSRQVAEDYSEYQRYAAAQGAPPELSGGYLYIQQNAAGADLPAEVRARMMTKRGYASGTDDAVPGWAWVGEDGPELMRMRGGEQILPNSVSRQVAEDYSEYQRYAAAQGAPPEFSSSAAQEREAAESYNAYSWYADVQGVQKARPSLEVTGASTMATAAGKMELHFHIEAGASPETVDAWQDYARRGELKATILEVMEEADADMRRRSVT